jgi:hypothetical protein
MDYYQDTHYPVLFTLSRSHHSHAIANVTTVAVAAAAAAAAAAACCYYCGYCCWCCLLLLLRLLLLVLLLLLLLPLLNAPPGDSAAVSACLPPVLSLFCHLRRRLVHTQTEIPKFGHNPP